MGKDHDHFASLHAILHKMMRQYGCGLEYVFVCEFALWYLAGGSFHHTRPLRMLAGIACEYLMDGPLEVRPVKVFSGVWNATLG